MTPLLSLRQVSKQYAVSRGVFSGKKQMLSALDQVSLDLFEGETLGLVGESGCGKSTLSRITMGLEAATSGEVLFAGQDLAGLDRKAMQALRTQMQMVFQDPATSLNPKITIRQILSEPFIIHKKKVDIDREVEELLRAVGLGVNQAERYPHQFSGGQRQRIGIARALALRPRLLVADEPVSALDVSIQAQILNLLMELKEEFKLTYILIAHDLSVVNYLSTRLAIMYLGKIVEILPASLFARLEELHPYTSGLWRSSPGLKPGAPMELIKGELPSPLNPPAGCRFHTRCPEAKEICGQKEPLLTEIGPGHFCACFMRPKAHRDRT